MSCVGIELLREMAGDLVSVLIDDHELVVVEPYLLTNSNSYHVENGHASLSTHYNEKGFFFSEEFRIGVANVSIYPWSMVE